MKAGIPGLRVFFPFAEHMARPNPNDCPSVTEALAEFKALVSIEHYLLRFGVTEFKALVSTLNHRTLFARIWRDKDTLSERLSRFFHREPAI